MNLLESFNNLNKRNRIIVITLSVINPIQGTMN